MSKNGRFELTRHCISLVRVLVSRCLQGGEAEATNSWTGKQFTVPAIRRFAEAWVFASFASLGLLSADLLHLRIAPPLAAARHPPLAQKSKPWFGAQVTTGATHINYNQVIGSKCQSWGPQIVPTPTYSSSLQRLKGPVLFFLFHA